MPNNRNKNKNNRRGKKSNNKNNKQQQQQQQNQSTISDKNKQLVKSDIKSNENIEGESLKNVPEIINCHPTGATGDCDVSGSNTLSRNGNLIKEVLEKQNAQVSKDGSDCVSRDAAEPETLNYATASSDLIAERVETCAAENSLDIESESDLRETINSTVKNTSNTSNVLNMGAKESKTAELTGFHSYSELDNEPKSIQREDAEKLRTKNKDTEEQRQKKVDKQRSTVKAGGEIVVQQKDINKEGRKVDAVEPQDSNKEKIMEERCADPAKQQATHIENMIANTQEVSRENVQGIGKVIVHRIILEDAEDEKLNKTKKNKNEVSTYSKLAKDVVVNNSQQPAKAELHNKHTEHTRDLSELPQEKVKIILHNITIEEPAITKNKCDNIIKENRLIKTTAADHEKGPIITEVEEDTVDKSQKSEVRNVLITEYKIDDEIPQDKVKIIVHNITVEEPTITEVEESSADAITSTVVSTELPVHQEFERFEELIDPECDISLPREIASIDKAEYDALVELLNDITAPLKEQQSTSSNQSQKSTLQVDTSPSQTVTAPPTSPISFLVAQEQENELMSPTSPIVTENNEPVYHTITDHEKQRSKVKQKRAALDIHFLPQLINPRFLDSIIEENSDISSDGRSDCSEQEKNLNSNKSGGPQSPKYKQRADVSFPKSNLDFSKKHKHGTIPKSPTQIPTAIFEETIPKIVVIESGYIGEKSKDAGTVLAHEHVPEVENVEYVIVESASSSSVSDLADNDSEDTLRQLDLEADAQLIISKPESETSTIIESSRETTPVNQTASSSETLVEETTRRPVVAAFELINKNDDIAKSANLLIKSENKLPQRDETQSQIQQLSDRNVLLPTSHSSSGYSTISKNNNNNTNFNLQNAAKNSTTTATTATIDNLTRAAAAAGSDRSDSIENSSSAGTSEFIRNISGSMEKHDNKNEIAASARNERERTTQGTGDETGNLKLDPSEDTPPPIPPLPANFDTYINEDVPRTQFEWQKSSNYPKEVSSTQFTRHESSKYLKDVSAKEAYFSNAAKLKATQPILQDSSSAPKEVSATAYKQQEPSHLPREAPATKFTHLGSFSNSREATATQLLPQEPLNARKEAPAMQFTRPESSKVPREMPATQLIHQESSSNSREPPATQFLSQESSGSSICSDLSQCTAINVTDTISSPDTERDISGAFSPTTVCDKKHQAAIKKLRLLCTDRIASMPFGEEVLEELAYIAQNIGELQATKLNDTNNSPTALSTQHIQQLQHRIGETKQRQAVATESGARTGNDKELCHEEEFREQQILKTAAIMRKLRKSLTPPPVAVTIPQQPAPPVPPKNPLTAAKAQGSNNTNNNINNIHKTKAFSDQQQQQQQNDASNNNKKSTEQIAHFLLNGEENKQQQQQLSPQHSLLAIIHNDANKQADNNNAPITSSSFENNSRQTTTIAGHPNMQRQILKEQEEAAATTTTSTASTPPVERVVPVAIEKSKNYQTHDQIIDDHTFSKSESKQSQSQSYLQSVSDTMKAQNRCSFPQSHMDTVDSPSGFYTFPKSLHENLGQSTAQKRLSNLETSSIDSYYGNRPQLKQQQQQQHQQQTSIKRDSYQSSKCIKNGQVVYDVSNSSHMQETDVNGNGECSGGPSGSALMGNANNRQFPCKDQNVDKLKWPFNEEEEAAEKARMASTVLPPREITSVTNINTCNKQQQQQQKQTSTTETTSSEPHLEQRRRRSLLDEYEKHKHSQEAASDQHTQQQHGMTTNRHEDFCEEFRQHAKRFSNNSTTTRATPTAPPYPSTSTSTTTMPSTAFNEDHQKLLKEFDELSKRLHDELEFNKKRSTSLFDLDRIPGMPSQMSGLNFKHEFEDLKRKRHEHMKELEQEIERSFKSRQLKRFVSLPTADQFDMSNGMQQPHVVNVPMEIENGNAGYGSAQPPKHAPAVHTVPMSVGPRQAEHHRPMPIKTDHHTQTPHVVNVPMKVETDANNTQTNFERRYSSDYTTSNLISSPSQIQSPNSVDLNYSYDQPPQYDPAEFRKRSESMFNLSTNNYNHHQPHAGYKQFEPYQSKQTRQPNQPYHEPVRRDPAEIYSQYASDLSSSENVFKPIAREVEICYQRCRPNTIRAPRLTASTNDLSASNQHYYDTHNAYNVRRTHAPMLQKTPQQHAKSHYSSCYSVLERDPNPTYISTTSRRGVSPAPQPAANATSSQYEDYVTLRNSDRDRRASLPREIHEQQLKYITSKEEELRIEFERLQSERQRLLDELSHAPVNPEPISPRSVRHSYNRNNSHTLPTLSEDEVFRQQMAEEWMNKVAEREERRMQKIIKISKINENQSSGGPQPPMRTDISEEFLNRVKERRQKLAMPHDSDWESGAESQPQPKANVDEDDFSKLAKNIKIFEGKSQTELQQLPKHLQEFAKLSNHQSEKIDGGQYELHEEEERRKEATDNSVSSAVKKTTVMKTHKVTFPGKEGATPAANGSLGGIHSSRPLSASNPALSHKRRKPHFNSKPLNKATPSRTPTKKLRFKPYVSMDNAWYSNQKESNSLLRKIHSDLNLAKSYLSADGIWTPKSQTPSSSTNDLSENQSDRNLPPTPPPPPAQPIWTPQPSPATGRKEFRPVRFESPTLPRRYTAQQSTSSLNVQPPWAEGNSNNTPANECHNTSAPNALNRKPNSGVSDKIKSLEQRSASTSDLDRPFTRRCQNGIQPFYKPNDVKDYIVHYKYPRGGRNLHSSSGYLSEPEPNYNYDSDYSTIKYRTDGRRQYSTTSASTNNNHSYGTMPNPVKPEQSAYKNQPGRIENYVTGRSSISEREKRENLEQTKLSPHYTEGNLSRTLAKESGYTSDSNLVFRKKETPLNSPLSPVEQKLAYKTVQAGGEPPLFGFRKAAPEKPKGTLKSVPKVKNTTILEKQLLRDNETDTIFKENTRKKANMFKPFTKQMPSFIAVEKSVEKTQHSPPTPPHRKSSYTKATLKMKTKGTTLSPSKRHEQCFKAPDETPLGASKYGTVTLRSAERRGNIFRSKSAGTVPTSLHSSLSTTRPSDKENFSIACLRHHAHFRGFNPLRTQPRISSHSTSSHSPVAFGRSISKERTFAEEKKRLENTLPTVDKTIFEASTNILRDPTLRSPQDVKHAVRSYATCAAHIRSKSAPHTGTREITRSPVRAMVNTTTRHRMCFPKSYQMNFVDKEKAKKPPPLKRAVPITISTTSLTRTDSTFSVDSEAPKSVPIASKVKGKPKLETAKKRKPDGHDKTDAATSPSGHTASLGQQYLSKHSFRDASPQKSENVIVTEVAHSSRTKLPSRKSPVTVDNYLSYHKSRSLSPARANHVESCTEEIYHYSDHESEQNEVGGVDDLVWQYESRGGATINAPSSLESNTSLKEKQFSPTREIRVPQTPRHVRSPSRRRIESCRNNVRANINKVTRASSLSSADDRAKRGFYLCSDLAHSATSLTHSEMHSPTCRYQKRFADLNHFYSTLERVGQLERTTSDSNFKPIRKHSDLLDYDEWQKVRQDERAEKELAYLVNKLKQEQREKDFLFRSKDVDDIKWRREADLSLHSREKSVEDLRGDFEHKLLTREKQKFKTENDGDRKPYWRRNTIGNLTASLERNTERKDQTDIKLSKQLVSTLSKEQITRITQQLCEIYGNVNDSKPIEAEEKYVITVNRTNKPIKPNNALKVRCNSSITKEDLLGPVIAKKGQTSRDEKKKSTATTTTPVKDYQNSMSPARRTCSPVFLARETRGAVAAKNAEVSFTKPSTVDLPKTKAHVVEQKSAPSKAPKEKLKVDTTDSAPQPQATANKADNKDNILQKIQFFEERQYPEPPPTVIYHAREESSPDEQEIMRLVEKNIKFREKAALQTRHKELSTSLISLGEAFGETKSPRINYCESPQLPEPPELPPPDDQTDTFASCTMDELEELEISRTDDDYAQFQENSSLEIYDSYFRSRSLPPTQQPSPQESSHLQRVRTGEVQKIREKFESNQNTATNEQNHFFGVGTLRKVRSDPELKKGSKDALKTTSTTTTTQPSDVSRIAYKFDTCERATKKSGKRSRSRNKKTQPKTQPDITTDSAQLQSTKITAKARVEKESSKKSQPNYITEGLVQRIRSRYEHNSPPPVKHWSSSHPDIRDINAFTSQLCFFEERYSRPMKRPNDLKLQQRPSSTSPYRPPRSLPHISISTYYEYPDIFANQKFDPKIHQPKARYVPNDKAEVCSGHSGKNKTGHALCAGYCSGLKKPSAVTFQESPNRYYESDVNIHFKTPVRHEFKDGIPEEELAQRQAEQMRKLYQEERRRKYLQELQDMNSRRHTDNFTPSQKSPIPLNRYDDFQSDLAPKTPPAKIYPKAIARALYNFQGQSAKELSVKKGDIIYLRRQIDRNWYEGEHNACIGLLPVNYVEIINRSTVQQPQRKSTEGQARAKYNFQAQSGIELSINKGELITLTRRVDANWFEGKIANRKGIFPVSYVEVLTDIGAESENNNVSKTVVNDRSVTSLRPSLDTLRTNINNEFNSLTRNGHHPPNSILKESRPSRKTDLLHVDVSSEPITYRALYKYVPQNSDELELLEGDIIHLLEKCDDGWFVGTSQRTGCFGTFPGNYVERA